MTVQKHLAVQSWKQAIALCAVVLAMVVPALSQSTQRGNRIGEELTSGAMVRMAGSVHWLTRRAIDLGEVNPEMPMGSLTLNFGLSAAEQRELDALLEAQQDPKSPQYHQWLTQEEYGSRFGLTDADLGRVTRWLESQGFTVKGVSKSRNAIHFSGMAWQVESAFHTQLHRYQLHDETHFANATELQVPAGLAGVLLTVRGLNDFRPKPQVRRPAAPGYTVNTKNGLAEFLTPKDWATIYNVNAIYAQTCGSVACDGTGMHVGIVGQTYAPLPDITKFRSASGLSTAKVTYKCISTSVNCTDSGSISTTGDLGEADLDIEWAGGVAKNATVDFVYAAYDDPTQGVFEALQYAVQTYKVPATGKVLPVVSMSYTDCEASFAGQPSYVTWITGIGQQANSQGQTLVVSSGDTGAAGCDFQSYPANQGLWVTVPVDSPNYTGVGGTTLSGDESDPGTYWNLTPNLVDSALQYIPETVWNDTSSSNGLSTSGGGVSVYFPKPSWQPTPGNYSGTAGRFVPDVAFAASADHDGYMTCSSDPSAPPNDCTTGLVSSGGYFDVVGGTSAAAPSFAGMLTLLVEKYGSQGNVNPTLYAMAANPSTNAAVFHDITSGNNIVPCVFGTTGCVGGTASTPGEMGYAATTGYDLTTGLGSINGGELYAALGGTITAATTTSVSAAPNPVALNGTTTLTATVTSTTAGTITGTVTFTVGSTTLGSPVTISGGTATLSGVAVTTAKGFSVGTDTITASYSGDTNFAASSGNTPLTVTTALPTPTTTVTATPNSIALGSSSVTQSFTATVTGSSGTPTGTVQFKVGSVAEGSPLTLSNGSATLSGIAPTTANGFTTGSDRITATYTPAATYAASSGTTALTVTTPAYSITPASTTVSLSKGGSQQVIVTLNSTTFADSVTLAATSSSPLITPTLSPSTVTLSAGGSSSTTLTITASSSAVNHAPALPWTGGLMAFGAVLAGLPLAQRRRRVAAVLLAALAISTLGFIMSCGGSGSSTTGPRSYTVTISGTGGIRSTINVSVQ
jgi:subtilase family serine protease